MPTKAKQHFLDRVSGRVGREIERDTDALADRLAAELLDDQQELSKREYAAWFRERFQQEPGFAAKMRERIGPEAFNAAYAAAFGVPQRDLTLARLMAAQAGAPDLLPDGMTPPLLPPSPPVPPTMAPMEPSLAATPPVLSPESEVLS